MHVHAVTAIIERGKEPSLMMKMMCTFTGTEKCGVSCDHNMEDHQVSMAKKTATNKIMSIPTTQHSSIYF